MRSYRRQETHAPIDVSHAAQLRDIEASFAAASDDAFDLKTLKHPTKNVTAVESYEVLPDEDIWANAYDLFRFGERPGDRPADVSSNKPLGLHDLTCASRSMTRDLIAPSSGP
jgi:RNA polymerase II-associated factor 1